MRVHTGVMFLRPTDLGHGQRWQSNRAQGSTQTSQSKPKLLDQLREALRSRHYSSSTEQSYCLWVKRYIFYHGVRHPAEMAEPEINAFLSHLAIDKKVSASTQNQALSALLFLYRHVLQRQVGELGNVIRAQKPRRLPVILSREEVKEVLSRLHGRNWLLASLLYGTGMRIMEALQLRIQDIDFGSQEITVRNGKGAQDRVTMLPASLIPDLKRHLRSVKVIHEGDLHAGWGQVALPHALQRKYPNAAKEWGWQWAFPQAKRWRNQQTGAQGRHHQDPSILQKAVREAVLQAGIAKQASCHTFRHSFATHLLTDGYDIRTIQELLGHKDVRTTMIYTHVLNRGGRGVRSPLDAL